MVKKTSIKTETEQVTTPLAKVTEKKTRSPKTPKVDATLTPAPVQAVVPELLTTNEQVVAVSPHVPVDSSSSDVEAVLTEQSVAFLSKLQQLSLMVSTLKTEYRLLEKKWNRELKAAQKLSSKRKRKAGNRAPSGFVKPTKISDELASFLGKEKGTEMARTEVTRDINKYIRNNNLQDKDNGRKINPDGKLSLLLKIQKNEELTYFNLQRYMSPHFAKANKDVVVAVVPV